MIEVKICVGTYSYIMGGADLMEIENSFPAEWKDKVKVTGAISISGCDETKMQPPYASVNGKIIDSANASLILEAIEKEINC